MYVFLDTCTSVSGVYEGKKYLRKKHILLPYKLLLFRSNIRLESKLWGVVGVLALFLFFSLLRFLFFPFERKGIAAAAAAAAYPIRTFGQATLSLVEHQIGRPARSEL